MMKAFARLAVALALSSGTAAAAATVTRSFSFTAANFDFAFGGTGPAPVDPATGLVTVTFDDAVDQQDVTSGVSFSNFNFAVDLSNSLPGYTFSVADNLLFIGTVCLCGTGGADVIAAGTDSFSLAILDPAGAAAIAGFGFSQVGFPDIAIATTGTLSVVPEPVTWATMAAGFAVVGSSLRRSRDRKRAGLA